MQRLALTGLPEFAPLLGALLADVLDADVLEQLSLLLLEEGLVPLRLRVLGLFRTAYGGELPDLAVVDVEGEEVAPAAEEDGCAVAGEDGTRLGVLRVGQPARRGPVPVDEVEVSCGGGHAPAAIRGDVAGRQDGTEAKLFLIIDPLGRAAGRTDAVEGARLVPLGTAREPAEVDPFAVVGPADADGRLPHVLGAPHDGLEREREGVVARGDGLETGQILSLERRGRGNPRGGDGDRGGGDPRASASRGPDGDTPEDGALERRRRLHGAPPPFPEGRYCPGIGRSDRSAAQ
ncbi:MAG: hypothetical protein F4012_01810 [Gemmatimonadales bacterium]|nr:hypothetical protein [Gemmatimonadales bacterium]